MSNAERVFLEQGGPITDTGSKHDFGLTFTSERDLDQNLWLDPEEAGKDLLFLLKVHKGEMTPALSRLALKGIALPLFMREFYGETMPINIAREVTEVPQRNSRLLDAYLDRIGEDHIDQTMLKQAIDDATVLQLVSRSLRSEAEDDIIMLPAGPIEDHADKPTTFTVLRRQNLGRALLFISSVRPAAYIETPQANQHRIQIRPTDLLIDGANRYDLAEGLIAEQKDVTVSVEDRELIEHAESHLKNKIAQHFDRIQPQS
jgi:hypothetical protein